MTAPAYLPVRECHFGHFCRPEHLTLVYFPEGCLTYPHDIYQWLCPSHTVGGLKENEGYTMIGYLHDEEEI